MHTAPPSEAQNKRVNAMPDLRSKLHQSWGWLLALGLVLILFGGLILTTPLGS